MKTKKSPTPYELFLNLLKDEIQALKKQTIRHLFSSDTDRINTFVLQEKKMSVDFCRERLSAHTLHQLHLFAEERDFYSARELLFSGGMSNPTEQKAAKHTWLRSQHWGTLPNPVLENENLLPLLQKIEQKKIQTMIHVGIGGSDLSLQFLYHALSEQYEKNVETHFVSGLDPFELDHITEKLKPENTLVILTSKTLSTLEVLDTWRRLQQWQPIHLRSNTCVVTSNPQAAFDMGFTNQQIFLFDESIGGRFSWSSSVGLSIILTYGIDVWKALLSGAEEMDIHFKTVPNRQNIPLTLALISLWNQWALNIRINGIYPYSYALSELPTHYQQLEMESLGKRITPSGESITNTTGNPWIGGPGPQVQHTFFQMLHQGTHTFWSLFILVKQMRGDTQSISKLHHAAIAQANALALGLTQEEAPLYFRNISDKKQLQQYLCPGNQSSTLLILPDLTAPSIGKLLALFEHKTFSEGVLMGINPFDQFGVEFGKQLAKTQEQNNLEKDFSNHNQNNFSFVNEQLTKATLNRL